MPVPVDAKVAAWVLSEICRIVGTPEGRRLGESARARPLEFQAVAEALVAGRDPALVEARGVSGEFLSFVLLAALRPSFRCHAERLQPLTEEVAWHRALCPICGSVPSLAELRGQPGRRYLRCALCEAAWRVPRLRCPFCGTTDHTQLRYLWIEDDPSIRLDLCDACRHYLKTRILPGGDAETDPFGRDLATLHLDALAWEQGYIGGSQPVGTSGSSCPVSEIHSRTSPFVLSASKHERRKTSPFDKLRANGKRSAKF
jgi:hypothetical protein